jgi:hypothetical protein
MCYLLYVSTTSDEDLSKYNNDLVRFEKDELDNRVVELLRYDYKWYVGSKSGCSCSFRHLLSVELGFSEPVDWYEEDEDDISATLYFINTIKGLIDKGSQFDCVDAWTGVEKEQILEKKVNLNEVTSEQFRFFENHHFLFEEAI